MDTENENRPLLHDFENETWRSRTRKRCIRIPSEAAITGLILGVFFVVVTLLIVLENMEKTEKDDISINKKLLASPGFNKKQADKSWQDEKRRKLDNMNKDWKIPSDQPDSPKYVKKQKGKSWEVEKQRKFDKVNKGFKILPNVTGNRDNRWDDDLNEDKKDSVDPKQVSIVADEYGREENVRSPSFFSLGRSDTGFGRLINHGYISDQERINEAWKQKFIGLQLPNAPAKKNAKEDEGWEKLSEQGWKNKEIEEALVDAWKNRDDKGRLSMSSSTFQSFIEKATDFIANVRDKQDKTGTGSNYMLSPSNFHALKSFMETSKNEKDGKKSDDNEKTEKDKSLNLVFDDFIDFIMEKIKEQEKNNNDDKAKKADDGSTYFMYTSEDLRKDTMSKLQAVGSQWERKFNETKRKNPSVQSRVRPFWKSPTEQATMNKQQAVGSQWERKFNETKRKNPSVQSRVKPFWKSPTEQDMMNKQHSVDSQWERKIDEAKKKNPSPQKRVKTFWKSPTQQDQMDDKADDESTYFMYAPINFDDFIPNINNNKKEDRRKEGVANEHISINDAWRKKMTLLEQEAKTGDSDQKILMSSGKMQWKNVDNGYKKLSTNGWNNKDMEDAVNKASGNGQILKTAMGDFDKFDMKWNKEYEGYKKSFYKS